MIGIVGGLVGLREEKLLGLILLRLIVDMSRLLRITVRGLLRRYSFSCYPYFLIISIK